MDLAIPVLTDPKRSFGPREPRITAIAWRGDRGEHASSLRINLVNAILGDLKQMLAIERGSRMSSDINRPNCLAARWIDRIQFVTRGKPNVMAIVGHTMHTLDPRKGSKLTNHFSC